MSKKDRIYMPMGTGGLLRYQDEEKVVFKVKPTHVLILVVVMTFLVVAMRFLFPGIA
jgi:preprotein translocase subunit Sec61beta